MRLRMCDVSVFWDIRSHLLAVAMAVGDTSCTVASSFDITDENHARLRPVRVTMALVGVVPLLGGVAEGCRRLLTLTWVVVFG